MVFVLFAVSLSNQTDLAGYEYKNKGFLTYQQLGQVARVCADSINATSELLLTKLGQSTCNMINYHTLVDISIVQDPVGDEVDNRYVDIAGPGGAAAFTNTSCLKKYSKNSCNDGHLDFLILFCS